MAEVDAVVNFAAETHVDRSIAEPDAFVARTRRRDLRAAQRRPARAVRYCRSPPTRSTARSRRARSPRSRRWRPRRHSATKAGADLLVSSYHHTFGLETLICRGSNNYGPYQYPEKLIPLMVLNALHGDKLPVYGDGMNVRNWLYVEDFARGIGHVLEHGAPGEAYNVGGPDECPNIEVVKGILEYTGAGDELIEYVTDRPATTATPGLEKVRALGWEAQVRFSDGLGARWRGTATTPGGGSRSAPGRLPRVLRAPVRAGAGVVAAVRSCAGARRVARTTVSPPRTR